jgi:cerevisin
MFFYSFFLFPFVLCQNYILIPKNDNDNVRASELASTFNLEQLASFDALELFTSSHDNLIQHKDYLSNHFDIEEDSIVTINSDFVVFNDINLDSHFTESSTVPWHLDRIVKHNLPLNNSFPYQSPGSCHTNKDVLINTYIVDTGIDISHPEFNGRATWGSNFADSKDTDCNNHGTHVSGLVGSLSYGVCTDANLIAVKVLDCNGSGSTSGVIKGIEWAFKSHLETTKNEKSKTVKSIINMSLGGSYSRALNKALETCVRNNNFYVVVAAGNENQDACDSSPASSKSILTVMASDISDNRAWFSNWGECTNIYSPGVNILSTIPHNQVATYSGTSMASPITTGVLNHYIDMLPQHNMKQMISILSNFSSKNVVKGASKPSTVSNLVYLSRN